MKLKNKKTGEIIEAASLDVDTPTEGIVGIPCFDRKGSYSSLAELNEDWEDYEEPKEYWYIYGNQVLKNECDGVMEDRFKAIGNYFESEEEAERALKKHKAWTRLEAKGFRFDGWTIDDGLRISICTNFDSDGIYDDDRKEIKEDLDICFGGEE